MPVVTTNGKRSKALSIETSSTTEGHISETLEQVLHEVVSEPFFTQAVIASILVVIGIFVARYFLTKYIKSKSRILDKNLRRWINRVNNTSVFLIIFSLVFIWGPEIQHLALSLTAVAVAIVLITKELLMCLTGGFLYASTKPFDVGDWITVDGITGEVTKATTLVTVIEEVDRFNKTYQYTGRTIQIPNSKFLSAIIENGNFIKDYIYHDITITTQYTDLDPEKLTNELKTIAETYFTPFREAAEKFIKRVEQKVALDFADAEPQYLLKTTDLGHNLFTVRLLVPTKNVAQINSSITRDFLKIIYDLMAEKEASALKAVVK